MIDGFYVLFSKMLSAVMYTLPFFCFMAALDVMYIEGFPIVMFLVGLIILVPVSLIAMGEHRGLSRSRYAARLCLEAF